MPIGWISQFGHHHLVVHFRWRLTGIFGVGLAALLAAGCSSSSTTPAGFVVPARDGTCVAHSVSPSTCYHVVATSRTGTTQAQVSDYVGRSFGSTAALNRFDLHDCAQSTSGSSGVVCTFWPGAPRTVMLDLVHQLSGSHLFASTELQPGQASG